VVQRARYRDAGLPFTERGKRVAISRQHLVLRADDQLHRQNSLDFSLGKRP
jgi:hypothetical protein